MKDLFYSGNPVEVLKYILPELDYVLIMTVNPGFGGQKFLPMTLGKIKDLGKLCKELGRFLISSNKSK